MARILNDTHTHTKLALDQSSFSRCSNGNRLAAAAAATFEAQKASESVTCARSLAAKAQERETSACKHPELRALLSIARTISSPRSRLLQMEYKMRLRAFNAHNTHTHTIGLHRHKQRNLHTHTHNCGGSEQTWWAQKEKILATFRIERDVGKNHARSLLSFSLAKTTNNARSLSRSSSSYSFTSCFPFLSLPLLPLAHAPETRIGAFC